VGRREGSLVKPPAACRLARASAPLKPWSKLSQPEGGHDVLSRLMLDTLASLDAGRPLPLWELAAGLGRFSRVLGLVYLALAPAPGRCTV